MKKAAAASKVSTSKRAPRPESAPTLPSPSHLIDVRIKALSDWRGTTLARLRALIKQALPDVLEEWKWSVPVWSSAGGAGIICTGETYKSAVKLTFPKGAALDDPSGLFNSSLDGATRRAIDVRENDEINEKAFKALIREAAALNSSVVKSRPTAPKASKPAKAPAKARRKPAP